MDVPASIDERRCEAPPAVGQFLSSGCTAELSEDGEIFDSGDDSLPSFKKILVQPKQMIDLTHDDDDITEIADQLPSPPTADCPATSSTAATPGKKKYTWKNVPRWSPLYRRLQQCSNKPLNNPSVDALHAGTDSPRSPSSEFEPAPKDFRTFITKRPENSLEIPETQVITLEKMRREEDDHSEDGEDHHGGSTQTVAGASVGVSDAVLESNVVSSSLRDRPRNEYDTGSVQTNSLQRARQTEPVVNTSDSDEPPLSIAESSGQTLASVTVSASSLPNLGEGDPVMIDISYFITAKILDKRSSPFKVEYRCKLEPLWLPTELVKEVPIGGVHVRSYENRLVQADRLGTLRDRKRKHSQMHLPAAHSRFGMKEQTGMAKKHKGSSLDTPTCYLVTTSLIALTASQRSQREVATLNDDSGSYQFPSHQLELPVVLAQDSIASIDSVDLEPIPESVV